MISLLSLYGGPRVFVDADSDGMILGKERCCLSVQTLCEQQGWQVNEAYGKLVFSSNIFITYSFSSTLSGGKLYLFHKIFCDVIVA